MKYTAKNPLLISYLTLVDACSKLVRKFSSSYKSPSSIHSILIANIAHLGDIVLSTSILPIIKKHYPHAKIGFLTSTASSLILKDHPMIDAIYTLDHPKLSRLKKQISKWKLFLTSFLKAKKLIKQAHYDIYIDLYPYYPNSVLLGFICGIPKRIGFISGGYGPLLTHMHSFSLDRHITKSFEALLSSLEIQVSKDSFLIPHLPIIENKLEDRLAQTLKTQHSEALDSKALKPFIILHLYAGDQRKNWSAAGWKLLMQKIEAYGFDIFLTGSKGDRKTFEAEEFSVNAKNLMGELSFEELKAYLTKAQLMISVDTFIVHLAASFQTPTIVIKPFPSNLMWDPPSHKAYFINFKNSKFHACPSDNIPIKQELEDILDQVDQKLNLVFYE